MARNFRSRTLTKRNPIRCANVVDGAQFPITYTLRPVARRSSRSCGWRAISDHLHSRRSSAGSSSRLWMARNFRSRTLKAARRHARSRVVDGAQFPITYTRNVVALADAMGCGWRAISDHVHSIAFTAYGSQRCGWRAISDHVHSVEATPRANDWLWMARNFRSRTLPHAHTLRDCLLWMARNFRSRTLTHWILCSILAVVDGAQFPITYTQTA